MPLYERVRGLEGSWEDLVRVDKLSELWRSRWDVALIDSSDSAILMMGRCLSCSMDQIVMGVIRMLRTVS
jgi:hypothetical protein